MRIQPAAAKPEKKFYAVGKRKTSRALVLITPGDGKIVINERELPVYFGRENHRAIVIQPLEVTGTLGQYNIRATLAGGGPSGQADALKYGIAKALVAMNEAYRKPLRTAGFMTRDSRIVERKKYGRRGARRRPQYSKR